MDFVNQLEAIVLRCQSGQDEAFEELFELYQPKLKYYARRLLDGDGNVDDTLQDIWITVFRKIHKLKDARAFSVWLYRIARNKIYSGFRRKHKFLRLPEEESLPQDNDSDPGFTADDAERLHIALNKIKPHHREVLTLSFIERMSYEQIASIVDCNIGTVRSRIFYAKKSLREEMERLNGNE
jgi:RNA polymerase sigma-70 factor (ECF subfamily)